MKCGGKHVGVWSLLLKSCVCVCVFVCDVGAEKSEKRREEESRQVSWLLLISSLDLCVCDDGSIFAEKNVAVDRRTREE